MMGNDIDTVSSKSKVLKLSKQGHTLLKARRLDEARTFFEKALAIDPENSYVLTGMGDVFRYQKNFLRAVEYYRQVLKFDPHNLFSLLGLGDALRGVQRYQEAIETWELYLRQSQAKNIYVLTRIADSYKRINDYENALAYYLDAYSVKPNDRYVLLGLADLYNMKGLDQLAIEHYEKAVASGVTTTSILTILGNLHLKYNNFDAAKKYYEQVLAEEPYNNYALLGLGNYYRKNYNYQQAAEIWEKILERDTGTANLLARLGDVYRNLGRFDDAELIYKKGAERGYNKFILVGMMKLHCQTGSMKSVIDCYEELLRNEESDNRFFIEAGQLLHQRGGNDMLIEFYLHVKRLQKNSSEICKYIDDYILALEK